MQPQTKNIFEELILPILSTTPGIWNSTTVSIMPTHRKKQRLILSKHYSSIPHQSQFTLTSKHTNQANQLLKLHKGYGSGTFLDCSHLPLNCPWVAVCFFFYILILFKTSNAHSISWGYIFLEIDHFNNFKNIYVYLCACMHQCMSRDKPKCWFLPAFHLAVRQGSPCSLMAGLWASRILLTPTPLPHFTKGGLELQMLSTKSSFM